MDIIVNTLGVPLFCIYLGYIVLGLQSYFSVKNLYEDFESFRKIRQQEDNSFLPFVTLLGQLKAAETGSNMSVIDNRIDQIWIEFDRKVQTPVAAIGSHSSSLILWGFVGTLYGAIKAFSSMSDMLENQTAVSSAFSDIMQGKLDVALYSSLLACFVAAFAMTLVTSYLGGKISKNMEYNLNEEIYHVLNGNQVEYQ
jgi:hypothetical protein